MNQILKCILQISKQAQKLGSSKLWSEPVPTPVLDTNLILSSRRWAVLFQAKEVDS